jgi:predicted ribosome quality control (RQC) complex YloA/Tae2 family protein
LACVVSGVARGRLVLEAARGRAGIYLLAQAEAARVAANAGDAPAGRARQAVLLFRKHVEGARVRGLLRLPGERQLVLDCGAARLSLRLFGAPALTLVVGDQAVATLGTGRAAWPPPAPDARAGPEPPDAGRPALALSALEDEPSDSALAPAGSVAVAADGAVRFARWRDAFARFLELRVRGDAFAALLRARKAEAERERKRLASLLRHLEHDASGQQDPDTLRRQAEALKAAPASVAAGAREAELPDPYDSSRSLRVALLPSLSAIANAERLFEKARRVTRARAEIESRRGQARAQLALALERLRFLETARSIDQLAVPADPPRRRPAPPAGASGPRRYLTSRGLPLFVGRGARENQRLTFELARPEDLWFHARDAPGAHVILRDDQGRAGALDRREAAEVAAFFSEAKGSKAVDVHCARRKHLRAAKGGPGRVRVGHSETLRVAPRDPEGRLRRRP